MLSSNEKQIKIKMGVTTPQTRSGQAACLHMFSKDFKPHCGKCLKDGEGSPQQNQLRNEYQFLTLTPIPQAQGLRRHKRLKLKRPVAAGQC